MVNHYAILGLSEFASADEIREAYRILAMRHHPDQNNYDAATTARFQQINTAYDVLGNGDRRSAYDLEREREAVRLALQVPHGSGLVGGAPVREVGYRAGHVSTVRRQLEKSRIRIPRWVIGVVVLLVLRGGYVYQSSGEGIGSKCRGWNEWVSESDKIDKRVDAIMWRYNTTASASQNWLSGMAADLDIAEYEYQSLSVPKAARATNSAEIAYIQHLSSFVSSDGRGEVTLAMLRADESLINSTIAKANAACHDS